MKRVIIGACILIVIISSSAVYAGIGFKGGIIFAKWGGDDCENLTPTNEYTWKPGVKLGAYFAFPIGNIFTIQPEIFYAMKGRKIKSVVDKSWESTSLNYIDIPVLAKFNMDIGKPVKPTIFAGPYLGYYLGGKMKVGVGEESMSADLPDDMFKSTEMGLVFGGGLDFEGGGSTFTLELRYSLGLTPIPNTEEEVDIKNRTLSVLGGMRF